MVQLSQLRDLVGASLAIFSSQGNQLASSPSQADSSKVEPAVEYLCPVGPFRSPDKYFSILLARCWKRNSILLPFDTIRQDAMK